MNERSGKRSMHYGIGSARASIIGSRTAMSVVSSKRNVAFDTKLDKVPKKTTVQVFDDYGTDVTPRSLLSSDLTSTSLTKNSKTGINFNDSSSVGTPSELLNQSMFGASTFQASYAAGFSKSIMSSMMGSSRASLDSVTDEISEPSHAHVFSGLQDIERKRTEVKETLTSADLKKMVQITLIETDTIWHLNIPSLCVNNDPDEIQHAKERNDKYEQLCSTRIGNDMYTERGVQTFNDALKTKEMQTIPFGTKDVGCHATLWDMYDTYNKPVSKVEEDGVEDDLFSLSTVDPQNKKLQTSTKLSTYAEPTTTLNQSNFSESRASSFSMNSVRTVATGDAAEQVKSTTDTSDVDAQLAKILNNDTMKENLFIMERTVVQNLFHSRQAAYRGLNDLQLAPSTPEEEEKLEDSPARLGPNICRLWSYECSKTKDLAVTCMVWNKVNHDLLAVGYGENGFYADGKGVACVWSIKNPAYPERVFHLDSAVVSIDFSLSHPNYLAVGLYNGTIAVFNIRNTEDSPVLDNINSIGKHSAPVWQLHWVDRDKGTGEERGEVLITSSADGRVTQWSIRKGFEYVDLMKLKRSSVMLTSKKDTNSSTKKSDALISRFAAGMCFDFHPTDGNMYLAGTEEGNIHKCSCSYNEQFLETYIGHKGSVYRMFWSPFDKESFLSCGADWTVRLWHVDKVQPVFTLQGSTKAVLDIDWSPMSAVIFAAINEQQIEVWDLSVSTLDPLLVSVPVANINLTSVKFALNSEALLVGDSEGHVTIYQLREMKLNVVDQNPGWLSKLINSTSPLDVEELRPSDSDDKDDIKR